MLGLGVSVAACAPPEEGVDTDAQAPCGGACGPGTRCVAGRCVADTPSDVPVNPPRDGAADAPAADSPPSPPLDAEGPDTGSMDRLSVNPDDAGSSDRLSVNPDDLPATDTGLPPPPPPPPPPRDAGIVVPSDVLRTEPIPPDPMACMGTMPVCIEGSTRPCYTGPPETRLVGICRDGVQTCRGGRWELLCVGQILPLPGEACNDQGTTPLRDLNCNGVSNEGCPCDGVTSRTCFNGPMTDIGRGVCRAGTQRCALGRWGATCEGQVPPPCDYATRTLDAIPNPHVEGAGAVLGDRLYVIAGTPSSNTNGCACISRALNTVDILDPYAPAGRQWSLGPPLNFPRGMIPQAVTVGCRLFVLGGVGRDGRFVPQVERLDPALGRWEALPSSANVPGSLMADMVHIIGPIFGLAAASVGTTVYALSHRNGQLAALDTVTNTWRTGLAPRPPTGRCPWDPMVNVRVGGRDVLITMGCGVVTDGGPSQIWEYDVAANTWTLRGSLPDGVMLAEHVMVANGTRVLTFGSDYNPWGDRIVEYDAAAHVATLLRLRLPMGRSDHSGGMIRGRMFLAGGIVPGTTNPLVPGFEVAGVFSP